MSWSPERYLQYGGLRLRPALDLIAQIAHASPAQIVDLGCGPGTVTRLLAERWPLARVSGVDSSAAMLEKAATLGTDRVCWIEADIAQWTPAGPPEMIFSNAALHWLDAHPALFARLAEMLVPGGVLAVQMPANFDAPSHRLVRELAAQPQWAEVMAGVRMGSVLPAADYWRLLAPCFDSMNVWETVYWQRLESADGVLEWLKGTTLVPYLAQLGAADQQAFLDALRPGLRQAYPAGADGSVLYPFRRLFVIGSGRR